MIGTQYWTTGIKLIPYAKGKWGASLEFLDNGFCDNKSTQGTLRTRYIDGRLGESIDTLIEDAKKLGIAFGITEKVPPTIYVPEDGEGDSDEVKALPKNWKTLVRLQCRRLGWKFIYGGKGHEDA